MPAKKTVRSDTDTNEKEVGDWPEQVSWLEATPAVALVERRTREQFGELLALTRMRDRLRP